MLTFKEFYLKGSKGTKAAPQPWRQFKTPRRQNDILERIRKLNAAKFRSRRMSEITR